MVPCGCILSKFYIKPQLTADIFNWLASCILSKFYIKPQRSASLLVLFIVVSYRNSTSNHNVFVGYVSDETVVSYRNSTSNHNTMFFKVIAMSLYLIEILHQTTTSGLILIDKVLLTGCLPL